MQSGIVCEAPPLKHTKKYSIDLSIFSEKKLQDYSGENKEGKYRKMTYDFYLMPERAPNPLEKDIMFQKMNE